MTARNVFAANKKREPSAGAGSGAGVAVGPPTLDRRFVRIAIVFAVTFGVLQGLLLAAAEYGLLEPVKAATTAVADGLIGGTGVPCTRLGNEIFLASRVLRIDGECTGLLIVAMYLALLVAYPVSIKTKAIGLLVGVPVILVVNMARLIAVAHLSERLTEDAFRFAHDVLFKVVMVAVVLGLWAWWLAYARDAAKRQ